MSLKSLIFSSWVIGFAVFILRSQQYTFDPHIQSDAIVVFTGSSQRIVAGKRLHNDRKNQRLLISGVLPNTTLQDLNLKGDNIVLGFQALDTPGNAVETAQWVNFFGLQSIVLVTSRYHLNRSLLEVRRHIKKIKIIPYPIDDRGLIFAIGEYHKYIISYIFGKIRRM